MGKEDEDLDLALSVKKADYVVSAAKAVLGAVPFAGSLLAEIAGTVIPNQRIDRIGKFAAELQKRIEHLEQSTVRAQITDENFTDLVEEGLRQAARSTTDDRREHIAKLIANSLSSEDVSFIESKHLLQVLGEINDIEVIWLNFYLNARIGGDDEFRSKHEHILAPISAHMGSPQAELDKRTLQDSYKDHLVRLGLLRERFKVDSKTKMPEFDTSTGAPKRQGYDLTPFGRLLLRQ